MARREKVDVTTGSAFHALGLPDADDLVLRSALICKVADAARRTGLAQGAIGKMVGLSQPRVSALLAGKISLFSSERLVAILVALGHDVEVRVRKSKTGQGRLRVAA
jgi:predicted XRE-type DNA-binding protein